MQTRETIDSKNRTLYELEDEEDVETDESLYDDYWDDEEDYSDESLYDYDYDYDYDDDWAPPNTVTTTETLQNPSRPRYEMPVSMKAQFTFWIFAGLLLLTLLGLRCIEKGNKVSKIIAATALGVGVVGAVLQMLMAWQVLPVMESIGSFSYSLSTMAKTTIVVSLTTVMTIACALIMRIRESEMTVKVLKWVSAGCGLMFWLLVTIVIFSSDYSAVDKMFSAGAIFLSCCIVSWATAWILSRFSSKESDANAKKEETRKPDSDVKKDGIGNKDSVELAQESFNRSESTRDESAQMGPARIESVQPEPNPVKPTRIDIVNQQTPSEEDSESLTGFFENS